MKDFGLILIYSIALFIAVKFFWKWLTGGFNSAGVWEWINRGFAFGLGFLIAVLVVILVTKAVTGIGG